MRTWSLNRLFALVIGIVFLLVGILGLLLDPTKGNLLGLFSVNIVHNLVHVLIGVLGIIAAFTGWSRYYNRGLGIVYLLVGILGFIPALTPGGELPRNNGCQPRRQHPPPGRGRRGRLPGLLCSRVRCSC